MWPGRAQGALVPPAFPGLPVFWNVGRLGIFTAKIFPSQSDRFQLEPGDSSRLGRGYPRGQGRCWGSPSCSALGAELSSHPLWEMPASCDPTGPGQGEPGLLGCRAQERQWEGLGTRDCTSVRRKHGWLYPTVLHFLQPVHEPGRGAALDSIPRWGCACQTQVLWLIGATQPWQEVALLSLSSVSVLHSVGPTTPLGPGSFPLLVTFRAPVPSAL